MLHYKIVYVFVEIENKFYSTLYIPINQPPVGTVVGTLRDNIQSNNQANLSPFQFQCKVLLVNSPRTSGIATIFLHLFLFCLT